MFYPNIYSEKIGWFHIDSCEWNISGAGLGSTRISCDGHKNDVNFEKKNQ